MEHVWIKTSSMPSRDYVEISLSDDTIGELFDEAFEGWCPICRDNPINEGGLVCCECFALAFKFHTELTSCGCIEILEEAK